MENTFFAVHDLLDADDECEKAVSNFLEAVWNAPKGTTEFPVSLINELDRSAAEKVECLAKLRAIVGRDPSLWPASLWPAPPEKTASKPRKK